MDEKKLWKLLLDDLELSVSAASFSSWFRPLNLGEVRDREDDAEVVILCPSAFHSSIVEKRFGDQIQTSLEGILEKDVVVAFVTDSSAKTEASLTSMGPLFSVQQKQMEAEELAMSRIGLSDEFSFENFAVSSSNEMAYAAAVAVAENFASAYNPLFLYGGVGVGKTHLMQAIAIKRIREKPDSKMIYCMSEEFTNDIIEAIQQKKTAQFRRQYRGVDGLFIDDIQFIAGKTTVQEEFFHTFNALLKSGGQVIMTSDRPPSEIRDLEARLKSRFEAGLLVDIGKPDFELRAAITLIKSKQKGVLLNMEEAQVIAANIESARKIEGFLTRLATESKLKQRHIDQNMIEALLGKTKLTKDEAPPPLRPLEVVRGVAKFYQIPTKQLQGKRRVKSVVTPRHIAMYLLRVDYQLPLTEVAGMFSNRDHTTVMHAVEKITRQMKDEESLRMDVAEVRKMLYS